MFLGIDMGFWYGMAATGVITLAYVLVCWLMPPKKQEDVFVIDNETEEVA